MRRRSARSSLTVTGSGMCASSIAIAVLHSVICADAALAPQRPCPAPAWSPVQGTQLRTRTSEITRGAVLEHLLVQHLTAFFHVGAAGNILLEGADWNGGMDMARERGESVAFTALYASNLRDLGELVLSLDRLGVAEVALAAVLLPLLDTLGTPVDYDNAAARQARLAGYFATCGQAVSGDKVRLALPDLAHDLGGGATQAHSITLPASAWRLLERIGGDNRSEGVRRLVRDYYPEVARRIEPLLNERPRATYLP